jgi:hypothetical protein
MLCCVTSFKRMTLLVMAPPLHLSQPLPTPLDAACKAEIHVSSDIRLLPSSSWAPAAPSQRPRPAPSLSVTLRSSVLVPDYSCLSHCSTSLIAHASSPSASVSKIGVGKMQSRSAISHDITYRASFSQGPVPIKLPTLPLSPSLHCHSQYPFSTPCTSKPNVSL